MIRQIPSDELRNWKRKTCDKLFAFWRAWIQLFAVVIRGPYGRAKKNKDKGSYERKWNVFQKQPAGTRDFSHWRRTCVSQLCPAVLECSFLLHGIPAYTDILFISGHVIAVNVLHENMGYTLQFVRTSQIALSRIDCTVPTIARTDMFFSTVIYYFCDDGGDKVGRHCLTLCSDTFTSFLPTAIIQLIRIDPTFVLQLFLDELDVSSYLLRSVILPS